MAIEYITSKNLFYLICDTLKLMDESLIKHGTRVSYITVSYTHLELDLFEAFNKHAGDTGIPRPVRRLFT